MVIQYIKAKIKKIKVNRKFQKKNANYRVFLEGETRGEQVTVGKYTYGPINALFFDDVSRLSIGSFCSIAPHVTFIVSADHYLNNISTYPFQAKVVNLNINEGVTKGNIIVKDDVWIGYGATIMSGVQIGQGAVIAAESVVTKDVPPYAIVGGVPARIIRYRFDGELIKELLNLDYSKLNKEIIESHMKELYTNLVDVKQLDWFPKKCD